MTLIDRSGETPPGSELLVTASAKPARNRARKKRQRPAGRTRKASGAKPNTRPSTAPRAEKPAHLAAAAEPKPPDHFETRSSEQRVGTSSPAETPQSPPGLDEPAFVASQLAGAAGDDAIVPNSQPEIRLDAAGSEPMVSAIASSTDARPLGRRLFAMAGLLGVIALVCGALVRPMAPMPSSPEASLVGSDATSLRSTPVPSGASANAEAPVERGASPGPERVEAVAARPEPAAVEIAAAAAAVPSRSSEMVSSGASIGELPAHAPINVHPLPPRRPITLAAARPAASQLQSHSVKQAPAPALQTVAAAEVADGRSSATSLSEPGSYRLPWGVATLSENANQDSARQPVWDFAPAR